MYSVLYVDDERDLLELCKIFLEQSPDFRVETAVSAMDALEVLATKPCDVIVSDFQMPGMDGIALLKTVRQQYGDVPFILFTGRGREEIVIEAINNGADFYLQKGGDVKAQFAELAHKIRQATARRQAEISLVESKKLLADIINFLPDATFAISREGFIIAWNRAIEEMTGLSAESMLGKGDHEYALPFYGERRPILIDLIFASDADVNRYYSHIMRTDDTITAETNLPHPKGTRITVIAKASPLYNRQGELVGAIETIRDITEQKKAEDELRNAYEQISASEEELREQLEVLATNEQQVRENASRLEYLLGFFERANADEKELMNYAVEGAGIVTGSPLGYLAFLNEDESELSMYAWSKSAMEECTIRDKPIVYKTEETGLWGEAVRQRRAVITNDYSVPNPAKKGYPSGHPAIVRHMNTPVIDGGHVVMVAGVANKPQDYTEDDIRQLSLLMQGLWQVVKQRKTRQDLLESEEKYRSLFENSVIGIFRTTFEGRFLAVNTTFARISGYDSPQEMLDAVKDIRTQLYVNPEDRDRFMNAFGQEGAVRDFEARFYHRDGHAGWIKINAAVVYDSQGAVRYYEGTTEDITVQKNAEYALEREKTFSDAVIDSVPGLLYLYDNEGRLVRWSKSHEAITGYSADELKGMHILDWYKGDEEAIRVISEGMERALCDGQATAEAHLRTKSGERIPFFFTVRRLEIDGKTYFTGVGIDITDRKKAEDEIRTAYEQITASEEELRGQFDVLAVSEKRVRESEERYRSLFDAMHDCVAVYQSVDDGEDFVFLEFNHAAEKTEQVAREEVIGRRVTEIFPGVREFGLLDVFQRVWRTGNPEAFPIGFYKDNRISGWRENFVYKLPSGEIVADYRDETEKKQAEMLLRESEERFKLALAGADLGTWNWNIETGGVIFNERWVDMLGYRLDEIEPHVKSWEKLIHPDEIQHVLETLNNHLDGRTASFEMEHRLLHKNGSWIWVLDKGRVIKRSDDGRPLLAAGTHLDITEKKMAEDALRESEERYRNFIDNASEGIYRIDFDQPIAVDLPPDVLVQAIADHAVVGEVNVALADMYNLKPAEMIGRPVRNFAPDCGTQIADLLNTSDYRIVEREEQEVSGTGEPVYIVESYIGIVEAGILLRVWGVQRDITDRKKIELALSESEAKYRRITNNARDLIYRMALPSGRYEYVSNASLSITGYTPEELYADPGILRTLVHPNWEEYFNQMWNELLKGRVPPEYEYQIIDRAGTMHWLNQRNVLVTGDDGSPVALEGIVTDISKRKQTEKTLREVETLYRSLVENSHDIIYTLQPDGTMSFVSPSWTVHLGYEPDEVVGKSFREFVYPDDISACEDFLNLTLTSRTVQPGIEFRVFHCDGSVHWYRTTLMPVLDDNNTVVMLVGNAIDFTDYRQAKESLRKSEARYRSVIENIQDALVRSDHDGILVMVSPSAATLFGYDTPEDILGKPIASFYQHPEIRPVLIEKMAREGELVDQTIEFRRRDGTTFWGSVNAHFVYNETGEADGIESSVHDVTEYRTMERAVREANHKLSLLNSITRHDVANQLTILQGYAQIAAQIKGDPVIADYLAKILAASDTIARQIEFTRTYQELGVHDPSWTSVETVIDHVQSRVPVRFSKTCGNVEIFADPLLERVFFNLFDNAARHGGNLTEITVRCEREPDALLLIVEDNGNGIPLGEKEKIFQRGFGKNSGLGLFLVREILSITGITIKETGISGKGARFEMLVPKGSFRYTGPKSR